MIQLLDKQNRARNYTRFDNFIYDYIFGDAMNYQTHEQVCADHGDGGTTS